MTTISTTSSSSIKSYLWILVGLAQLLGFAILILTGIWLTILIGQWSAEHIFNFHPLFMMIGLLFFYGESIMFYRIFSRIEKLYVKIAHTIVHALALLFALLGLIAIIISKNMNNRLHFQTSHSWTGLACIILFITQWILGFLAYLFPKFPEHFRRMLMPLHRYFGIAIFALSIITILSGINYINKGQAILYGNFLTLLVILFSIVVSYVVTNYSYRRIDPIPPIQDVGAGMEMKVKMRSTSM